MSLLSTMLFLLHVLGMMLAVGSASTKLALLLKSKKDLEFLPVFIGADEIITKLIIIGLLLLTISGIGWLLMGYPLTVMLVVKIIFVAVIWVLGPIIDNVVRPKFKKLAPADKEKATTGFLSVQKQYLVLEGFATGIFYLIVVAWVMLMKVG